MAMNEDDKREIMAAVLPVIKAVKDAHDQQIAALYNEIERILTHVAEVRVEVQDSLGAVVGQVFGDAYEGEVMGHYKRFLVAECVRVGVGVGEYAKVQRDVGAIGDVGAVGAGDE